MCKIKLKKGTKRFLNQNMVEILKGVHQDTGNMLFLRNKSQQQGGPDKGSQNVGARHPKHNIGISQLYAVLRDIIIRQAQCPATGE